MNKNNDFKMIDSKDKKHSDRPEVMSFVIKHIYDECPDISHLQQDYKDCGPEEAAKYRAQDKERLDRNYAGDFHFMGVRADCEYLILVNSIPPSFIIQTLTSGGLWGIESDSDEEYIKSVEQEQLDELKGYCQTLGIKFDENTPIVHKEGS